MLSQEVRLMLRKHSVLLAVAGRHGIPAGQWRWIETGGRIRLFVPYLCPGNWLQGGKRYLKYTLKHGWINWFSCPFYLLSSHLITGFSSSGSLFWKRYAQCSQCQWWCNRECVCRYGIHKTFICWLHDFDISQSSLNCIELLVLIQNLQSFDHNNKQFNIYQSCSCFILLQWFLINPILFPFC